MTEVVGTGIDPVFGETPIEEDKTSLYFRSRHRNKLVFDGTGA